MSQNFDEFSKHLAAKQSRRGILKLFAGGVIGTFTGVLISRNKAADAAPPGPLTHKLPGRISFNSTLP
jgi:hypothetical protein